MRVYGFLAGLPLMALAACTNTANQTALPTQANVDLARYAGTWYEQARLPNRFQDDCAGQARADYKVISNTRLEVVNQCITDEGSTEVARGEGRVVKSDNPNPAILEVRFAPASLSWLPSVWGDYWIIKTDYEYSLVGTPDRKYLWVLSRTAKAADERVDELLQEAASLGFDTDSVIRPSQPVPTPAATSSTHTR